MFLIWSPWFTRSSRSPALLTLDSFRRKRRVARDVPPASMPTSKILMTDVDDSSPIPIRRPRAANEVILSSICSLLLVVPWSRAKPPCSPRPPCPAVLHRSPPYHHRCGRPLLVIRTMMNLHPVGERPHLVGGVDSRAGSGRGGRRTPVGTCALATLAHSDTPKPHCHTQPETARPDGH